MLGRQNDVFTVQGSAEDQMKWLVVRAEAEELYEKNMYKEAAKRVIFHNCMPICGLDRKSLPNFNRNFYYNMPEEQACLQDCFNTRMKLHFGSLADKEDMLIDFAKLKKEYQGYENWLPINRVLKDFTKQPKTDEIESITQKLLAKSKQERFGKYEFQ